MLQFLETATQAADAGVKVVNIMDGRVRHCVLKALSGEVFGTRIVKKWATFFHVNCFNMLVAWKSWYASRFRFWPVMVIVIVMVMVMVPLSMMMFVHIDHTVHNEQNELHMYFAPTITIYLLGSTLVYFWRD